MSVYNTGVVGIDLGDRSSVACVYNPGVVVEWFEFAMTPAGVRAAFDGRGFRTVVLEAGAKSGWVTRAPGPRLQAAGREPAQGEGDQRERAEERKSGRAEERKSDRNDAHLLAKLATAARAGSRRATRNAPYVDPIAIVRLPAELAEALARRRFDERHGGVRPAIGCLRAKRGLVEV